jgi:5-methylcytosine-specific restriction enzyme subunit McrC
MLYEKAVAGFYDVVLSGQGWRVRAGTVIRWQIEDASPGISRILPSMRTDIVLDHASADRRIIIDTKFTSIVTEGRYREETLRSGYIYQMYAYLRSQETETDPRSLHTCGLLLHPAIDRMIDESVVIQGHRIRFATVDLNAGGADIRKRLLEVVGVIEARLVTLLEN